MVKQLAHTIYVHHKTWFYQNSKPKKKKILNNQINDFANKILMWWARTPENIFFNFSYENKTKQKSKHNKIITDL